MKTCKSGYYYCTDDKKCKPIPGGYHIGRGGWLEKDEGKKNGKNSDDLLKIIHYSIIALYLHKDNNG